MNAAFRLYSSTLRGMVTGTVLGLLLGAPLAADEMQWIWSPEQLAGSVPEGSCYFRKFFTVDQPLSGELRIAADDEYEVFLNGRRIGTGKSTEVLDLYDVNSFLRSGQNLLAVRVANTGGGTAALGVRMTVKEQTRGTRTFSSDSSWLTHLLPLPLWHTPLYNDSRWAQAQTLGRVGSTPPWDEVGEQTQLADTPSPAAAQATTDDSAPSEVPLPAPAPEQSTAPELASSPDTSPQLTRTPNAGPRANPAPAPDSEPAVQSAAATPASGEQFVVEQVLDGEATGSLLALTFNEFGHVLASREQGGVVLMHDADGDGLVDRVRVASDQIKDCRGLLCLNGELFATGQGPEGLGLYRLADRDRNGVFERTQIVLRFEGQGGRHGPRGLDLGRDGHLYVAVGCQARPAVDADSASPYHDAYEGDLIRTRYPDPDAGLAQVAAPGGAIYRLTPEGKDLQAVAGGLYDAAGLAFDQLGELFAQDSEAAADWGTPWFRQAAVYHVLPGGEFGWRSGSAKWPAHFLDRLPPTLETGRGIAMGMTFYNHEVFPQEYRNALFIANWTYGRIAALKLTPQGGSYTAASELFVDDPSLHVTDLAVGPDGAVYFTTGDQGQAGGLFRIRWTGASPPGANAWGSGVSAVVRQPQFDSAWSRQKIATEKLALGADWGRLIAGVNESPANPWSYRTRALDLLQLFGPSPTAAQLVPLAGAKTEQVRAKAAELMGLHSELETRETLVTLLHDSDRAVCRRACEALVRSGHAPAPEQLVELLKSDDRHTAWAARRLLERIPAEQWSEQLLAGDSHRQILQASLALLTARPSPENARRVLDRMTELAGGFMTDRDFTDLLRLMQLALLRGEIAPEAAVATAQLLTEEFPSSDPLINRELLRLLAYLRVSSIMDRYLDYMASSDVAEVEKLHVALHLPLLSDNWNMGRQIQLIEFLDAAQSVSGGSARASSVTRASRDFAQALSDEQSRAILAEGDRWPHAAIALLYRLPEKLDAETRTTLTQLDGRLQAQEDLASRRLKVGLVAVLARSGDASSLAYLRDIWDREPERRPMVAMGLAQSPAGENWNYLVRSLAFVEADVAQEILEKLCEVELAPEEPEYYRQVILRGLESGNAGAKAAVALLEHWTGERLEVAGDASKQLLAWQKWFAETWPDQPEASRTVPRADRVWQYDKLLAHLANDRLASASVENGAAVFLSAGCAKCHRCGEQGSGPAPDLTGVAQRLMRKEIVQSLLHPSEVVAVPYLTNTGITTPGRVLSGRTNPRQEPGKVVVQPDGQRVSLPQEGVNQAPAVQVSAMPEGLLEPLTAQEVQDLFAFLLASQAPQLARQPEASASETQAPEASAGETR